MDSTELARLERLGRRRYEAARLARAVLGFAPVLVVVVGAALLGSRPSSSALFGGALFAAGVTLLWRGQGLQRAVLPGVLSGLIPLALSLAANLLHGCSDEHCTSLCIPACTVGGVAAGLVVSTLGLRRRLGWGFWAAASGLSVLTGAMGCACVGYSGVGGLVAGVAVAVAPQALRKALGRA